MQRQENEGHFEDVPPTIVVTYETKWPPKNYWHIAWQTDRQ